MNGRRNGGRFDLCPIVVQFDSPDSRGSNRFSLGDIEGGEYGKNDPGEDASVKGKNAEDEVDELPDRRTRDQSNCDWSRVAGRVGNASGLGGDLTGP